MVEHFDYVKMEYTCITVRIANYNAILEDSECDVESKENLIARVRTILVSRQENANDEAHHEQVAKRSNAKNVHQQQAPLSQELHDKPKAFF